MDGINPCIIPPPHDLTWIWWAAPVALLATYFSAAPLVDWQKRIGWVRANWRGHAIPTSLGIVLLIALPVAVILASIMAGPWPAAGPGLIAFLVALCVGIIDDQVNEQRRGWAVHLRALFTGAWTAGSLKIVAIVIGSITAVVSLCVGPAVDHFLWILLAAAVIASAANVANILDTGPGRVVKIFIIACLFIGWSGHAGATAWLLPIVCSCLVLLPIDLSEKAMLGDAGANALGAAIGFGIVLAWPLTYTLLIILLLLVGIQVLGDRYSFRRIISSHPLLAFLDNLGRWQHNSSLKPAGGDGHNPNKKFSVFRK